MTETWFLHQYVKHRVLKFRPGTCDSPLPHPILKELHYSLPHCFLDKIGVYIFVFLQAVQKVIGTKKTAMLVLLAATHKMLFHHQTHTQRYYISHQFQK